MSSVRVLVGTHKGAFVLTSDGKRETWDGGSDWGLCSHDVVDIAGAPMPGHP